MRNRLISIYQTINKAERGMVFPIVLIALLLMGLLIPPLMGLITTSLVTGRMYENSSYELYAADAGVMDATWLLQSYADPGSNHLTEQGIEKLFGNIGTDTFSDTYIYTVQDKINGKTVVVRIVMEGTSGTHFKITSTATGTNGSTTTIETRVQFPPPPPPIYMAAAALNGNMKLNASVGGETAPVSIYADGNIDMLGSSQVYGDAYYTPGNTVSEPSSGIFDGTAIETTKLQIMDGIVPEPTAQDLLNPYNGGGNVSLTVPGVYELGWTYIDGDLKITAENVKVILTGPVWVSGKILITSSSGVYGKVSDDEFHWLVSYYDGPGDAISIGGGEPEGEIYKIQAALYAKYGSVYVAGTASLEGSVVGGTTVDVLGDSKLTNPIPFQPANTGYQAMKTDFWKIT